MVWAADCLGGAALGQAHWRVTKATMVAVIAFVLGMLVLYGLDVVLRPIVWVMQVLFSVVAGLPGIGWLCQRAAPTRLRCRDLDWRGPAAPDAADNDFYRDVVRARGTNRLPNHVLVRIGGHTARLDRGIQRLRVANRNGQMLPFSEVVSCNNQASRTRL